GIHDLRDVMERSSSQVEVKSSVPDPPRIVVVNKGASSVEGESIEQDAYMKAFGLFSTNNYSGAIQAFQSFITSYPRSEYAGNAQYWIGECYYTQRDYSKALKAFNMVIDNYPKGNKVPDAMLKAGYSLISMNQHDKAKPALEALVETYPKTPAAMKARERLIRY
ncbi:MAG: tol-pal system protein YbgF, partial [Geobacter sp.]